MKTTKTRIAQNKLHFLNTVLTEQPEGTLYKPVQGFSNYYILSNGKVYSCLRGIILSHSKSWDDGYPQVILTSDLGPRYTLKIHSLVCHAFLDKPTGETITCHHKDSDKSNNDLNNLMFVTQKQNVQFALEDGRIKLGENHVLAKYDDSLIVSALIDIKNGHKRSKVADKHGISMQYINQVMRGKLRKHLHNDERLLNHQII